ncbi:Protein CBG24548 [Caenorhabditis briggsae]|uniref:Protein CBG24548 n=1 Tax=Caenorhabditis briggsae TaxID=6238 RepID=B0K047_CAEBR|nr:Protein CBG24548 [Caenorhabditis briggsae]CAP21131.1 Protein CBG24548 [Caenorhabditis briggsae]
MSSQRRSSARNKSNAVRFDPSPAVVMSPAKKPAKGAAIVEEEAKPTTRNPVRTVRKTMQVFPDDSPIAEAESSTKRKSAPETPNPRGKAPEAPTDSKQRIARKFQNFQLRKSIFSEKTPAIRGSKTSESSSESPAQKTAKRRGKPADSNSLLKSVLGGRGKVPDLAMQELETIPMPPDAQKSTVSAAILEGKPLENNAKIVENLDLDTPETIPDAEISSEIPFEAAPAAPAPDVPKIPDQVLSTALEVPHTPMDHLAEIPAPTTPKPKSRHRVVLKLPTPEKKSSQQKPRGTSMRSTTPKTQQENKSKPRGKAATPYPKSLAVDNAEKGKKRSSCARPAAKRLALVSEDIDDEDVENLDDSGDSDGIKDEQSSLEDEVFEEDEPNPYDLFPFKYVPRVEPPQTIFSVGEMARRLIPKLEAKPEFDSKNEVKDYCIACLDYQKSCNHQDDNEIRFLEFWTQNYHRNDGDLTKDRVMAGLKEIANDWL